MILTLLPALSDQLNDYGINAGQLHMAMEAYDEALTRFIDINHDQFERPMEYLEAKDHQATIQAFLTLLPKITPDQDLLELIEQDEEEDYDD